jgi:hypothetical protein
MLCIQLQCEHFYLFTLYNFGFRGQVAPNIENYPALRQTLQLSSSGWICNDWTTITNQKAKRCAYDNGVFVAAEGLDFFQTRSNDWAFLAALYRAGRWRVGIHGADWCSGRASCYPIRNDMWLRKWGDDKSF